MFDFLMKSIFQTCKVARLEFVIILHNQGPWESKNENQMKLIFLSCTLGVPKFVEILQG
jgi:hypothetical protein